MTFDYVKGKLKAFLSDITPGVIAIKGKWGAGKTFLVQQALEGTDYDQAYISLFGINSIEDLQEAAFVQLIANKRSKGKRRNGHELRKLLKNVFDGTGKLGRLGGIGFKTFMALYNSEGTIICIDDIERKGKDLSVRDVFGFVTQQKEQRGNRIILILNEDELGDEQKELELYRERVIDGETELAPTPKEIIREGGLENNKTAARVLQKLEVDNIRAVQKIKDFLERLEPQLKKHPEVREKMTQSATILGWFYLVRRDNSGLWKFVETLDRPTIFFRRHKRERSRDYGSEHSFSPEEIQQQKVEEEFASQLASYGYETTGPLEKLLIKALKTGFYSEEGFAEVFSKLTEEICNDAAKQKLREAQKIFDFSFRDNENEYVEAVLKCFTEDSKHYSPNELVHCGSNTPTVQASSTLP
ncbi:hypothetical protein BH24DEI2_BH24DEI2_18020 [soil metagenome]